MRLGALAASVAAVLGLLLLGACARPDPGDEARSRMHEAMEADLQLKSCLERDGWDSSLEDAVRRRIADPDFNTAVEQCAAELGIDVPEPGDTVQALNEIKTHKIECLRSEGWTVPEPSMDADGLIRTDNLAESVPTDRQEQFWADFDRCGVPG